MKPLNLLLIVFIVVLVGCASHDYRVKNNKLYLRLNKPDAQTVYFASSLDGFTLHKAERLDSNTWQIVLSAGTEIRYFYMIDDLLYVPPCRFKERDDFGTENCIYVPGM